MSETKHTPGPWSWGIEGNLIHLGRAGGRRVANLGFADNHENQANARLIAAAPELLEACKSIVDFWDSGIAGPDKFVRMLRTSGFIDDARVAIAKAEGRS